MGQLSDKVALVTGGGSGIGLAIADAFAADGATVIIVGRRENALQAAAARIREQGGEVLALRCDVADETEVDRMFGEVADRFGALDLLVNNAGTLALGGIDEIVVADWDRVIATNLRGAFLCSRHALRMMKLRRAGRIINIGSISARRVRANNAAYSASKFALEGLTHCLALEGRPHGISCCIIHPGNTRSEITDSPDFPEPLMEAAEVARVVALMAALPANINMLETVILPLGQPFLGRG